VTVDNLAVHHHDVKPPEIKRKGGHGHRVKLISLRYRQSVLVRYTRLSLVFPSQEDSAMDGHYNFEGASEFNITQHWT
jgi:hypothetical protein